jgi:hypothetical protein
MTSKQAKNLHTALRRFKQAEKMFGDMLNFESDVYLIQYAESYLEAWQNLKQAKADAELSDGSEPAELVPEPDEEPSPEEA